MVIAPDISLLFVNISCNILSTVSTIPFPNYCEKIAQYPDLHYCFFLKILFQYTLSKITVKIRDITSAIGPIYRQPFMPNREVNTNSRGIIKTICRDSDTIED
jgi:hypothetical protein